MRMIFRQLKRRFFSAIIQLFGIIILTFFLFHAGPGDPTNMYFGPRYDLKSAETLKTKMGLNQPWYEQLGSWMWRLAHGDLGYSWAKHRPVKEILVEAIPATLQLTITALILNMILGCCGGLVAGVYQHTLLGKSLNLLALILYSIPPFWLALLLVYVFSYRLHLLPASGMSSLFSENFHWLGAFIDRCRHLLLPALVLGLVGAAATFRLVRANIQHIWRENFITLAEAKGLPARRILLHHAMRNALLPVVTLLGLYIPFLLGGAFVVEVIFAWPGMGRVTYEAVFAKDFPVLMSVNLIVALLVLAGNTLADLLYHAVDPRIRLE